MVKKLRLGLGLLLLLVAIIALVPLIGHVLAFGMLVIKLVAEVAFVLVLASLGFWLVLGARKA